MKDWFRQVTGVIIFLLGVFLTVLALREEIAALLYAIPMLVIGAIIFFNKKEDEIEQIKK